MNLGWLISIMAALVRMTSALNPRRFSLQQTMLRIKDPKITIPFYEENFGMKLLHRYDFPQWQFSIYFMGLPPPGEAPWPEPGTKESEQRLWTMDWSTLELTHNHGTELDVSFNVNNGNAEPHRGFGHIAMMTPDVALACEKFDERGLSFQKKPDGEWLCAVVLWCCGAVCCVLWCCVLCAVPCVMYAVCCVLCAGSLPPPKTSPHLSAAPPSDDLSSSPQSPQRVA